MYGQDDGNLTASISQSPDLIQVPETSLIWSTDSASVRNWQYKEIEMKAAKRCSVSGFF